MVVDQRDAHFFYIIRLFQSSTCFEQTHANHQEVNCIHIASGIVILCTYAGLAGFPARPAYRTATYRE